MVLAWSTCQPLSTKFKVKAELATMWLARFNAFCTRLARRPDFKYSCPCANTANVPLCDGTAATDFQLSQMTTSSVFKRLANQRRLLIARNGLARLVW